MHINNPDALKSWLAIILEPLCDADPSALARYVLALLKKEKPLKELTQCMAEQLDVFLGDETKPFLDRLFVAIKTEEYAKPQHHQPNILNPILTTGASAIDSTAVGQQQSIGVSAAASNKVQVMFGLSSDANRDCTPPILENKTKESLNKNGESDNSVQNVGAGGGGGGIIPLYDTTGPQPMVINDVVSKTGKDTRRRRASLRSRSRSRSRSYDRLNRRSRSRDRRIAEREKTSRLYRNKSPPPPLGWRSYAGGGGGRQERSPRSYGRARNESPRHSHSRSRSGSLERRKKSRSESPSGGIADTENIPPISHGKRQRCRDFDEKGYCMRGETCPWDHGVDPVVLEDINNPSLISIQSATVGVPHGRNVSVGGPNNSHSAEYNPDAPDLWARGGSGGVGVSGGGGGNNFHQRGGSMPHRGGLSVGNYPRPPGVGGFRGGPNFPFSLNPAVTPLQRELISVPVVDANIGGDASAQVKRRFEPEDTVAIAEGPPKRKPINNRLGPRVGGGGGGNMGGGPGASQNCSLELRKVPRGLNSIAHLNNHFSKFGKIVNIQISYDGDPEAAIITFSTHAEANVAYRSTEAVLNNRFIKVFWHTANTETGNAKDGNEQGMNLGGGSGGGLGMPMRKPYPNQYQVNNVITAAAIPPSTATPTSAASSGESALAANASTTTQASLSSGVASTPAQLAQQRLKNTRINRAATEIIRKKQEEQVKAAVQLAHGLHKRKHELLQQYLKQMRSIVELVERVDNTDPIRPAMLATIKDLQASIDKLRKEIASEQAVIAAQLQQQQPPPRKSKEQQQKELLDVELELITQQQEGNDTSDIQKRLIELQRTYSNQTGGIGGGIGIGGGGIPRSHFNASRPPRVRPAPPGSTSVDRRPTTVQIVGFSLEDSDSVMGHFKHYGEITKNVLDKNVPSLTISYATRSNAEQAMLRGRVFKEKALQLTWSVPVSVQNNSALAAVSAAGSVQPQPSQADVVNKVSGASITTASNDVIMAETNSGSPLYEIYAVNTAAAAATATAAAAGTIVPPLTSEIRLEDEEEEEDVESETRSWRR